MLCHASIASIAGIASIASIAGASILPQALGALGCIGQEIVKHLSIAWNLVSIDNAINQFHSVDFLAKYDELLIRCVPPCLQHFLVHLFEYGFCFCFRFRLRVWGARTRSKDES